MLKRKIKWIEVFRSSEEIMLLVTEAQLRRLGMKLSGDGLNQSLFIKQKTLPKKHHKLHK